MSGTAATATKPNPPRSNINVQKKSPEELVAIFNNLRLEQRQIANKILELENDVQEHRVVIDNLKLVSADRKCYRMIGGILIERTVKEVLPDLQTNLDQLQKAVEQLTNKLTEKGKEINDYKEKHNIQFQVPEKIPEDPASSSRS